MIRFLLKSLSLVVFVSILLNINLTRRGTTESVDLILEFFISFLSDIQSELIESSSPADREITLERYRLSSYRKTCPHHTYMTRIVHRNPLILYIENFLTQNEIQHLIELTKDSFQQSSIYSGEGKTLLDTSRTSTSAGIDRRETPVVTCIERRFAQFQGIRDVNQIEPLQVVKYKPGQQAKPHYDWFGDLGYLDDAGQRITTFFTYLQANGTAGETEFMEIPFVESIHKQSCDILTCDENSSKHGLRFRPIPGNSVFWYNVHVNGTGDFTNLHAGLPPGNEGHKIGLNTWTRERILDLSGRKGFPQPMRKTS